MRKIKLLKPHKDGDIGDVIAVGNNIAFGLVDNGTAEYFIETVQSKFGETKAISKPIRRRRRKYNN